MTGCTEPAAIAFAASAAVQAPGGCLPGDFAGTGPPRETGAIRRIVVGVDHNVIRNAASAMIPGMDGMRGPAAAAAAGICLSPYGGINLLASMTHEIRARARLVAMSDKVTCSILPGTSGQETPEIRVTVTAGEGDGEKTAVVWIAGRHDRIRSVSINGQVAFTESCEHQRASWGEVPVDITHIIRLAETADASDIGEVFRGITMNLALAREHSRLTYGLGLGTTLHRVLVNQKGKLSIVDQVRIAAAADARMGGAPYPFMSTAGSGNRGITALVPIGVVSRECRFSPDEIGRAGVISHLVTYQVDRYVGRLSPLCGCSVKAGMGAAAGITYLIGAAMTRSQPQSTSWQQPSPARSATGQNRGVR